MNMQIATEEKLARYDFSKEELAHMSTQLAEALHKLDEIADERKEVLADLKHRTETVHAKVSWLGTCIRTGFEMRKFNCQLVRNFETRRREWHDVETGEIVAEEPFQPGDAQRELVDQA